jgi:hypothetical protein
MMPTQRTRLSEQARDFYVALLKLLNASRIPYLIGGAYALAPLTGIERHTKDLDLFLKPVDLASALRLLEDSGYRTETSFPHWLAKAFADDHDDAPFADLIYRSGNGLAEVDDEWFDHAIHGQVLGVPVRLIPSEENLWSKAFVMERERFDGADVAHLILAAGRDLDWERLIRRFGPHWRVLLAHLVLFGYIYPSDRDLIPERVLRELLGRLHYEVGVPSPTDPVCQGTLLSREQYLYDIEHRGLEDGRVEPRGPLTTEDVELWTEAIGKENRS